MPTRLRSRVTYANVASTLALFVALGGGAYAAATLPANSVGAKQLKPDAVRSSKVKDRTLVRRDVKAGQFVTPGQLSLGYVHGRAHLVQREFDATADDDKLMPIRGGGAIALKCSSSGYNIYVRTSGDPYDVWQWFATNGQAPGVQHRHVTSDNSLVFLPQTDRSVLELDAQGAHGALVATVWGEFDNTTKHCTGRVRGIAYP